ncbi:hypothetical protein HanIR_Chr10g0474601 [Helianthus annuus]|nr:hypothetical protein HanIR_Chr10g0474601 [Helianthus annuus]
MQIGRSLLDTQSTILNLDWISKSTFTSYWLVSMLSVYVQILCGETKYKSQVRSLLDIQSTILNP